LILNYGSCSWGQCTFCGYGRIAGKPPSSKELISRFNEFFRQLPEDDAHVKVFGSGSFFDEAQIPKIAREHFIKLAREKNAQITLESRPQFITSEVLGELMGIDLTVAIGLESAVPELLEAVCKGFTVEDFTRAASLIHEAGFKVRSYLLVNIPGDRDLEANLKQSVETALKHSDSLVLINLLPHGDTPVFDLWVGGEWSYLSKKQFHEITAPYADDPRIELDEETFRFKPRFPKTRVMKLAGVGEDYLTHPYFEVWHDYILRWYQPPEDKKLLFLPCSYTKPYSRSRTHKSIIEALKAGGVRGRVHEVMVSNAGVIPREFEDYYPFNDYDWDEKQETPEIQARYIEVTSERIRNYLSVHGKSYKQIYYYLKPASQSAQALRQAAGELGFKAYNLLSDEAYTEVKDKPNPLIQERALEDLKQNLKWLQ